MKFLTNTECADWSLKHGYSRIGIDWKLRKQSELMDPRFELAEYQLPEDSGQKVALAKKRFGKYRIQYRNASVGRELADMAFLGTSSFDETI